MSLAARLTASERAMAELAAAIGEEAATKLAGHFGGSDLSVPKVPGEHHPIRVALGDADTARLVSFAGGGRIYVPKLTTKRQRVIALHQAGALTIAGIAREADYCERHVYRLISGYRDPRQLDMFEE